MDFIPLDMLDRLSSITVLGIIALSIITDKLVWHTRLKKAEERADRWETIALKALNAGAMAGLKAAEATVDVVASRSDASQEV